MVFVELLTDLCKFVRLTESACAAKICTFFCSFVQTFPKKLAGCLLCMYVGVPTAILKITLGMCLGGTWRVVCDASGNLQVQKHTAVNCGDAVPSIVFFIPYLLA